MKASELIEKLQALVAQHGDLLVAYSDDDCGCYNGLRTVGRDSCRNDGSEQHPYYELDRETQEFVITLD